MSEVMSAVLFLGLPMCLSYFVYRLIDRSGKIVRKLTENCPFIERHKFLVQIGGMAGFVLVFGIISILAGIPKEVFYAVSGLAVGLINGISAAMMYSE
ncbi:hypothetical protein [Ruminococcus sp. Marseille-P6503]|uniref:hypothetical protein n=1 Tax=Ruminococcus sp. Marseille-P6503 TaxID=2364796 RepID=UPI000F53FD10|nr:hypothetical protein [Ruminococcus sp. Marseille-P6503]